MQNIVNHEKFKLCVQISCQFSCYFRRLNYLISNYFFSIVDFIFVNIRRSLWNLMSINLNIVTCMITNSYALSSLSISWVKVLTIMHARICFAFETQKMLHKNWSSYTIFIPTAHLQFFSYVFFEVVNFISRYNKYIHFKLVITYTYNYFASTSKEPLKGLFD